MKSVIVFAIVPLCVNTIVASVILQDSGLRALCVSATFLPYPGDCRKFVQCTNGQPYEQECPLSLFWNNLLLVCDWTDNYCTAVSSNIITTSTSNPVKNMSRTVNPIENDCTSEMHYLPYPGNCHKFIQCSNGQPYVMDCPDGLYWNNVECVCDWTENYCNITLPNDITVPNSSETTSLNYESTTTQVDDIVCFDNTPFLTYPWDCHKYIQCSNGIAYVMDCPDGLFWNDLLNICDWTDGYCNVISSETTDETITKDDEENSKKTTAISSLCSSDDEFLPYPEDCHMYIQCNNGIDHLVNCSDGLYWNSVISTCDWTDEYCVINESMELVDTTCETNNEEINITSSNSTTEPTNIIDTIATDAETMSQETTENNVKITEKIEPTVHMGELSTEISTTEFVIEETIAIKSEELTFKISETTNNTITGLYKSSPHSSIDLRENLYNSVETTKSLNRDTNIFKMGSTDFDAATEDSSTKSLICISTTNAATALLANNKIPSSENIIESSASIAATHPVTLSSVTTSTGQLLKPCSSGAQFQPYLSDCNKFIQCSNGIPYLRKCPFSLYWDVVLNTCNWTDKNCFMAK